MNEYCLETQMGMLFPHLAPLLCSHSPEIRRLVGERLISGYTEHGSSLFNMSDTDLELAFNEEVADQLIYKAEQLRRINECAKCNKPCSCPAGVRYAKR